MLKKIGTKARKELEELLGTKVYPANFRESSSRTGAKIRRKVRELDWHFQLEGLGQDQQFETQRSVIASRERWV